MHEARRYPVAIAPFADMRRHCRDQSFAALGALLLSGWLRSRCCSRPDPVTAPPEFKVVLAETGEQMVGTPADCSLSGVEIVRLGAADVPAHDGAGGADKARSVRPADA